MNHTHPENLNTIPMSAQPHSAGWLGDTPEQPAAPPQGTAPAWLPQAIAMRKDGASYQQIGDVLHYASDTIRKALVEAGEPIHRFRQGPRYQRTTQAVAMREAGATYRAIAVALDYSQASEACRAVINRLRVTRNAHVPHNEPAPYLAHDGSEVLR